MAYLVWLLRFGSISGGFWASLLGYSLGIRQAADFADSFFAVFMAIQMLAVLLLTPAYTSGAIAVEKARGTLEMMLGTDLSSREIVLGIYVARIAHMAMLLIASIPILSLLELMGGVDVELILAGSAAEALTVAGFGALGLLNSIRAPRPRTALYQTYLLIALYMGATTACQIVVPALKLGGFPTTAGWRSPVTLDDILPWLAAGNPISAAIEIGWSVMAASSVKGTLPDVLLRYACFHVLLAIVCLTMAIGSLRANALGMDHSNEKKARRRTPRGLRLPQRVLDASPFLWKDAGVGMLERRSWFWRLGFGLVVAALFLPILHVVEWFGALHASALRGLINTWALWMSTAIGTLLLVQVALRAAGTVSGEKTQQTLENVLATPIATSSILRGKWLGSLLGGRPLWLLWAATWCIAVWLGDWTLAGIGPLLIAWLSYAAVMASLGLYFSVASRSTAWAILGTVLGTAGLWLISTLLAFDFAGWGIDQLCPPLGLSQLSDAELLVSHSALQSWVRTVCGPGPAVSCGIAAGLWLLAAHRFRSDIGRTRRDLTPRAAGNVGAARSEPTPTPVLPSLMRSPTTGARDRSGREVTRWAKGTLAGAASLPRALMRSPRTALRVALRCLPLFLPLALLIAWYGRLWIASQAALNAAITEADRLDPGWRMDDLGGQHRPVPPERNSILKIVEAARLKPRSWPELQTERLSSMLFAHPQEALPPPDVATLAADLERAALALGVARQISGCPETSFERWVDWKQPGPVWPHLSDTCTVSDMLNYDILLRVHQGNSDGAVESCQALVNTARSLTHPPALCPQLARIRDPIARKIERALAQGTASAGRLSDLQRTLEDDLAEPVKLLQARAGRAQRDDYWESFRDSRRPSWLRMGLWEFLRAMPNGSLSEQRAAWLHYNNQFVEVMKSPDHLQFVQLNSLPGPPTSWGPWTLTLGNNRTFAECHWPWLAELRCAVAMLAMERYRLATGHWPDSLDKLVPTLLREVPIDPFDGQPIRIRRLADGIVIYTVGFDGKDDGGNLVRKPGVYPFGSGIDIGVRLWDPSARRQRVKNSNDQPAGRPAKKTQN